MPPRKPKPKAKDASFKVPQSREEADALIRKLGEVQRDLGRSEADMNEALAKTKAAFAESTAPLAAAEAALVKAIQAFCEARRDELTDGGRTKTYRFPAGDCTTNRKPCRSEKTRRFSFASSHFRHASAPWRSRPV